MHNSNFSTALVVSTYNWPQALRMVLESLLTQTCLPTEILIADDGSNFETKKLIDQYRPKFSIPVVHFWHEDDGFKKTTIVNKAINSTSCDYIIQIDGDIITHPEFIKDHIAAAEPGFYVRGSRTLLNHSLTQNIISLKKSKRIHALTAGIKNRINSFRQPKLAHFFTAYKEASGNVHGCNCAFWRKDFALVNGYDNRFSGWGHEDIELAARFVNNGILQKKIKLRAVCYHLHHQFQQRNQATRNFRWYLETVKTGLKRCTDGCDQQYTHQYEYSFDDLPTI